MGGEEEEHKAVNDTIMHSCWGILFPACCSVLCNYLQIANHYACCFNCFLFFSSHFNATM